MMKTRQKKLWSHDVRLLRREATQWGKIAENLEFKLSESRDIFKN